MNTEVKVRNASQAIEAALTYLRERGGHSIPATGDGWQGKTLYATGVADYAITSKLFTSGDWRIEVSQGIVPISKTIYQVTVFNPVLGSYWKGNIKADGSIDEASPMITLSEEKTGTLAEELARRINVPPPKLGGYGH
jgi:hypothetical protein